MDTFVYRIGNNLYINLTNRCSNNCTFCVRDKGDRYEGYDLWLKEGEPDPWRIIGQIGGVPGEFDEIVFCGYGEPTYRLEAIRHIGGYVHQHGGKTRLNTNGHGSLINKRNIVYDLAGVIDEINISLNAPDKESYDSLCRPTIDGAFEGMIEFAKACKAVGINCWFSVVDCIGEEAVARCQELANSVGIPLLVRKFIN